jgi:hypothetical protein
VRRVLPLLVLAAALAGCGGSGNGATTTKAAAPGPADTLRRLVAGDPQSMQLLTPASRKRVAASELAEGVAAFADDVPVKARQVGGGWAVAWAVGTHTAEGTTETMAYAVPLQRTGGRWLAEISPAIQVRPLGPDQGETVGATPQVAAELKAPEPIVDSSLLVDGAPLEIESGGPSSNFISMFGAPREPLAAGRHVAVAFARAGTDAAARAWTFEVS